MTVNKRKKDSRQRGSKTHGWGAMKKHRGSGNRGGKGNAGSGKRADSKKPSFWNRPYFGKFGFKSKSKDSKGRCINLSVLSDTAGRMIDKKQAIEKDGMVIIDLNSVGISKLLGSGTITKKFKITVLRASARAIEKVEGAGGSVTLLTQKAPDDGSDKGDSGQKG